MMAAALERAKEEQGLSVRQLAKQLGYKQAVVLSHMANGKSPIPIDRAEDIAGALDIDKKNFLREVVEQRHPEVSWNLLAGNLIDEVSDGLAGQLEAILGASLDQLNSEQRRVMREVVADPIPGRRWVSVHDLPDYQKFQAGRPPKVGVEQIIEQLEEAAKRGSENSNF
ncbi:helix-turn-helix transcriptional regulator [Pontixanthobacter sp. CEM42]|uniref:helix-turn-helix domain-containing protein n=1 Tax=Pontixanthobacter sp. CEM42 TaxID=2792077 RepID=UPI001ADF45EF|nr:helix-turn-helix transcriptional regulator [Pontixanthobacter sp. CEM42]